MKLPLPAFEKKVIPSQELAQAVAKLPRPVVMTNGVFDILHRGHATYLAQARSLGASLVVAVNSDSSVRQLGKGPDRPVNPEADRAALLAALQCVDAVTLFTEKVPLNVLQVVKPDIYVKGGDYRLETLPEARLVQQWGGRVVLIDFDYQRSTTALIGKIRRPQPEK